MPNKVRQQQMRQRIAAVAARLMAEDGIDDFGHAKRKAARQLGVEDTHALPNNDEVEEQLRAYQSLYQDEEQHDRLRELRAIALEVMQWLADFRPHLTGPVLKGTATRYSDVDLHLFTDDPKAVDLLLLRRGIAYEARMPRRRGPETASSVAELALEHDGVVVNVSVFTENELRTSGKKNGPGKNDKASLSAVELLVSHD